MKAVCLLKVFKRVYIFKKLLTFREETDGPTWSESSEGMTQRGGIGNETKYTIYRREKGRGREKVLSGWVSYTLYSYSPLRKSP